MPEDDIVAYERALGLVGVDVWKKLSDATRSKMIDDEFAWLASEQLIPTAEIVDSSNDFGGWYRAPGWRAAARRTKTHANGHSL